MRQPHTWLRRLRESVASVFGREKTVYGPLPLPVPNPRNVRALQRKRPASLLCRA